jgi:tetratricopeptide (TPR) repeat protein
VRRYDTLYDLLGALPDNNAEGLRAAFRKAARINHPDNNPGDPAALRRFRRIVRVGSILTDERQRAAYDRLLAMALQEKRSRSKRRTFSNTIRIRAHYAIVVAGMAVGMLIGGLAVYIPSPALLSAKVNEKSERERTTARKLIELSEAAVPASPVDKVENIVPRSKLEGPDSLKDAPPALAAPGPKAGGATPITKSPPVRDFGPNDAKYYRELGISAYRSGDLYLALVDFNIAVELDPSISDAYIDRAILFYRLGDLKRAFADIARAKRIDDANGRNMISPGKN